MYFNMEVTIGGDRLGSGNKQKQYLNNFYRSTHDLSQRWSSPIGCGMLIPCLCIPAMRDDVFDININGACRTLPTNSPLFSTFKMQIDIFDVPMRLYQGILHNNPLFIGLKMSDVKFPVLEIETKCVDGETWEHGKFADNSLLKYLGMSGLGTGIVTGGSTTMKRKINAIPALAYMDIFKNYYANKQEDQAYVISTTNKPTNKYAMFVEGEIEDEEQTNNDLYAYNGYIHLDASALADGNITATLSFATNYKMQVYIADKVGNEYRDCTLEEAQQRGWINNYHWTYDLQHTAANVSITFTKDSNLDLYAIFKNEEPKYEEAITLNAFDLANIDTMRMELLSYHTLGAAYKINSDYPDLPYSILTSRDTNGITKNHYALNGILVKTYQADLFNAWVNTEWVDGSNGIAEMSKIAVTDNAIYMDAFLLAEKTYNLLNRVAVAGGTYEAWQDVVYTESPNKHIESPIYCGGLSNEVVFEEIVQTTPTEGAPLGTLGGRGIAVKRKGGHVSIKCDEASFIMGIVSITPRVYYGQGNEFYMTELLSMDDLHKPSLDGIGFQNLLGERMCWSDTKINKDGAIISRTKVGKVPAWVEYMTAVDKAYGEFLDMDKQGSMILNRNYKINANGSVDDFTTYIDPAKYNYVFGNAKLDAQNFWVQIDFDIKARRLMSAKQIPNL